MTRDELAAVFSAKLRENDRKNVHQQAQAMMFLRSFHREYLPHLTEQEVINFLNNELYAICDEVKVKCFTVSDWKMISKERFYQLVEKSKLL